MTTGNAGKLARVGGKLKVAMVTRNMRVIHNNGRQPGEATSLPSPGRQTALQQVGIDFAAELAPNFLENPDAFKP